MLEVFANAHSCLAARLYPGHPAALGVGLFAQSGRARLLTLDVWTLASIW